MFFINYAKIPTLSIHLTYFALLFRPDLTNDDKVLTILDIIFTVLGMLSSVFVIIIYKWKDQGRIYRRKPITRNTFQMSVTLLIMNIVFFFGQQVTYPANDNPSDCLVVAIMLHWVIVAFFIKMFYMAMILLMGSRQKFVQYIYGRVWQCNSNKKTRKPGDSIFLVIHFMPNLTFIKNNATRCSSSSSPT